MRKYSLLLAKSEPRNLSFNYFKKKGKKIEISAKVIFLYALKPFILQGWCFHRELLFKYTLHVCLFTLTLYGF